ncbi:8046_t:CDS:2 [Ambispora gerdemannii]|uniref:8046_t:CDS:1 n=1 Tax=Ambispora gerdemannii TaxID=144530 RepID=A0A9N8VEJ3_9GLOM|nr:8046_t:CDS:2 [Ambispora gerdemannii]
MSPQKFFLYIAVIVVSTFYLLAMAKNSPHHTEGEYKTYIVVFKKTATDAKVQDIENFLTSNGGRIKNVYSTLFKGFTVEIPSDEVLALDADNDIDFVEEDQKDLKASRFALKSIPSSEVHKLGHVF